jgi:uncharacterized membrane protein
MTVTTPIALILLLVIPLLIYIGWPRSRYRRTRDSISLLLRVMIVTLVVLALAGTQIVRSAERLAVVFLVDVSDSMGTQTQEAALEYIRETLPHMRADDLAGVVVFGADAQVARSMSSARELGPIRTMPDSSNTNIAAAIRLGLALFPEGTARRMVILSDGLPTLGDSESAAQLAAAAGVEISYVPFVPPPTPEVQVSEVSVPPVLAEDQEFDMRVTVVSEEATEAIITVLASGEIVSRRQAELRPGENHYTLRLRSGPPGFRDFLVQVDPLGEDGFFQNNSLGAFTRVEGAPRVLVISGAGGEDEIRHIVPALQSGGLQVDLAAPGGLPIGVAPLAQYESVMLVNVSAATLTTDRMRALESYVSDLGGGLVVVGGPDTYGPGGYYQTPLEDALPVEMQIKDQQRLPQLTIAYVIDRSGSMAATVAAGVSYLDLAKEAIIRSVDFLQPSDRAGIASFDHDAYWIADFQYVNDRVELQRLVATLRASGGTSIMAGMELTARDIVNEPTDIKHIILLTDGGADPARLVELTQDLYDDHDVTTSVISIGSFEARFLREMAQVGGGHYHHVTDPTHVPTIFALETVLASRTYIFEETFTPTLAAFHPMLQGVTALPSLHGYVATSPRPAAQVILRGPEPHEDPLLAAWQYGLGRSVAFMSDATARWGQDWVTWDEFADFWSQAVRWTITEGTSSNLETRVVMEDEQARIIVDARADDGSFLNGLRLETSVVYNPARSAQRVTLRQTAPGRYEGAFQPEGEGAYFLRVTGNGSSSPGGDEPVIESPPQLNQTVGWVMRYSAEYDIRAPDDRLLAAMADLTGGRDLSAAPAAVFDHNLAAQTTGVPLWPWLLLVALALLPVDVAVRRLLITRSDVERLSAALRLRFGGEAEHIPVERISTLRQARDRARQTVGADNGGETAPDPVRTVSELRALRNRASADVETSPPPEIPARPRYTPPKPEYAPTPPVQAPEDLTEKENIGAKLLKRRRGEQSED